MDYDPVGFNRQQQSRNVYPAIVKIDSLLAWTIAGQF